MKECERATFSFPFQDVNWTWQPYSISCISSPRVYIISLLSNTIIKMTKSFFFFVIHCICCSAILFLCHIISPHLKSKEWFVVTTCCSDMHDMLKWHVGQCIPTLRADIVSPQMSTMASCDRFKPIRVWENILVDCNHW